MTQRSLVALGLFLLPACGAEEAPGFDQPSAAVYDAVADVYLVANANGGPLAKDGNGYIARVNPDGTMQRRWIAGGRDGVVLHAPRGIAVAGDVIWVTDVDVLRRFDRASGRPLGEVAIPDATSLWGVAAGPDGTVWCTDAGLGPDGAATSTDAIWRIAADGSVHALARGVELGQPTGLYARRDGLYVVGHRDGSFFEVDHRGVRTPLGRAPAGGLTGLVRVEQPDGRPVSFAASLAGSAVYRFDLGGGVTALSTRVAQPGALGVDPVRRVLLVPLTGADRLELLPL